MDSPFSYRQCVLPWLILGGIALLQAMNGTRFIYAACSKLIHKHYGISRVQLNNLIVASESGRLLEFISSSASENLPSWMILIIGLIFGSIGYGVQFLCIIYHDEFTFNLSYRQILLLNFLAGNSICWINTYCELVAIRNFKHGHENIMALASSYSGFSGKIYTCFVEGIKGKKLLGSSNSSLFFLLCCVAPAIIGLVLAMLNCVEVIECEEGKMFPFVSVIVIATGIYATIIEPYTQLSPKLKVVSFVMVVMLPFVVALLVTANQPTLEKLWGVKVMPKPDGSCQGLKITIKDDKSKRESSADHGDTNKLVQTLDFWLFHLTNMCGTTLGLVYLSNMDIICELKGYHEASFLMATSSFGLFFGKIFSVIFFWYTREKSIKSKAATSVMLIMMPMTLAFFLLIGNSNICLYISTGIIGTGTGAINAIIAASTSEFIGSSDSFVHRMIVRSNIPIGILLFGYLVAHSYEGEGDHDRKICMGGMKCHQLIFTVWGSICFIGTMLSVVLFLRLQRKHPQ